MNLNANIKARNVFDIQVKDAQTGQTKQQAKAFNTITQNFVSLWSRADSGFLRDIAFGTGQGKPSYGDTALFKWLGTKQATTVTKQTKPPTLAVTKTIRLAAEEFVGQTITEVGFSSTREIQTHAMIVDSEGQAIAIQKTGTDIIDIYATVYFELPDPSEVGPGARWQETSYLFSSFLGTLWHNYGYLYEEYPYESVGGTTKLNNSNSLLSKSINLTALPEQSARKYDIRILETEANRPIKAINFNDILQLDVSNIDGVWAGKTFTDIQVATGDGATKDFNIPHPEFEDLTLKVNGQELTPEDYVINGDKTPEYFHSQVVGRATLPELVTEKNHWRRIIKGYTQHPTEPNRIILIFPNAATTALDVYAIEISEEPFNARITDVFTVTPADDVLRNGDILCKFIADDLLFIGWGREEIVIKDFALATGKFGQEWTRHPNLPKVFSGSADYFENRPMLFPIPKSNFVIMNILRPASRFPKEENIVSFSLNRTTKVFGENVNKMTELPEYAKTNAITGINLHPTEPLVTVVSSGQYFELVPYEPSTGLFGAPLTTMFRGSESNPAAYEWHPSGEFILIHYNYNNNRQTATHILEYDKETKEFLDISSRFPKELSQDYLGKRTFLPNGDLLSLHTRYTQYEVIHSKIAKDGTFYTYGTYKCEDMISSSSNSPAYYLVGDFVMWVEGRYLTATSQWATEGPFLFTPLQHIVDKHITLKNPLPTDAKLTATYHVPYIPKTKDYVLDLSVTYSITGV